MIDEILEKFNLKYEDLNVNEQETLNTWLEALQKNKVSVETVREHIKSMKSSVEGDLTKTKHNTKQDIFLKARLRNYLLLESFLTTPKKAKKQLESALAGIAGSKKT